MIDVLVLEGELPINIVKSVEKTYGDAVIGYSTVNKWVYRIRGEEDPSLSDLRDKQRSVWPSSAINPGNGTWMEELD